MKKFPRRISTDQEYQSALRARNKATQEFQTFLEDWCPPAKIKELQRIYSYFLDFEAISHDYDAMHLTEAGQVRTRLTYPDNLYGWDCESTLWFRWCLRRRPERSRYRLRC